VTRLVTVVAAFEIAHLTARATCRPVYRARRASARTRVRPGAWQRKQEKQCER
jgi:hypothetical protein